VAVGMKGEDEGDVMRPQSSRQKMLTRPGSACFLLLHEAGFHNLRAPTLSRVSRERGIGGSPPSESRRLANSSGRDIRLADRNA